MPGANAHFPHAQHSSRSLITLYLKFSLLYAMVILYFAASFGYSRIYTEDARIRTANVATQTLRYAHVTFDQVLLNKLLLTEPQPLDDPMAFLREANHSARSFDFDFNVAARRQMTKWTQQAVVALLEQEMWHLITLGEGLLFGTTQLAAGQGVVGMSKDGSSPEQRRLNLENACLSGPGMSNCTTLAHGTFAYGLQSASHEFVERCGR